MGARKPLGLGEFRVERQRPSRTDQAYDSGPGTGADDVELWPSREPPQRREKPTEQLAMRITPEEKRVFDQLAMNSRISKPALLRRMMRAYRDHPDPESLDGD